MTKSLGFASTPLLSGSTRSSSDDYEAPELSRRPGATPQRSLALSVIFISFGLISTSLLGFFVGFNWKQVSADANAHMHPTSSAQMHSSSKTYDFDPSLDPVSILFQEKPIYSGPPSNESDAAWAALIPAGRGFVDLGVADQEGEQQDRYCVSVFHQLHCLNMIRQGFYAAMETSSLKATPVAPDGGPVSPVPGDFHHPTMGQGHSAHASSHMRHCFDYLRQALMCGADATLEERSDEISGVRGWGTTHRCRNFQALKAWTEGHRYSDETGIDN